ncbi:MAG: hypothetical protein HQL66_00595 [Magnetococcales bacterium]|nr:hypothetical protein [Magnetococcales bacterium]
MQELKRSTNVSLDTSLEYVNRLRRAGIVTLAPAQPPGGERFHLAQDYGADAPLVDERGVVQLREATGQERMWRGMRLLKIFSWRDLAFQVRCTPPSAKDYIQRLAKAGTLEVVEASRPGRPARYRITPGSDGPQAPRIARDKSVFNPNASRTRPAASGECRAIGMDTPLTPEDIETLTGILSKGV